MVFIVAENKFNFGGDPIRDRGLMLRPLRLKLGMFQPLRLKTDLLRLCATEETFCEFVQPKQDMLLLCATQKRYVANIATENGSARPMLRLCAAQISMLRLGATHVATLCDS